MKNFFKFAFSYSLSPERTIFLHQGEFVSSNTEKGKDIKNNAQLPLLVEGKELSREFKKELKSQKELASNGEIAGEDVWNSFKQKRTQKTFCSLYDIKEEAELTKEQTKQLKEFESFVEETDLVTLREQKSVGHLLKEKLSSEQQEEFFHGVKGLKIEQELLKSSDIRKELEKEEFDEESFKETFQKYTEKNNEFREFYEEYVIEEKEIQNKSSDKKLIEFQSSVTKNNENLKESAHLLSDQILGLGGTLGITSVRSHKGGVALFAHDKIPKGGTVPLLIYVNQAGKWNIEGDRGIIEEPFDPNKPGNFELALKNMRYRSMAIYASQQMNVLQNFDENISSEMLRSLVLYFEKDIRGSVSPEGKFVILCKKWGKDQKIQKMGLGKWMKYKLFNDGEILNQIAIQEAQEEVYKILQKGEKERVTGEVETEGDSPQQSVRVEKPV